MSDGKRIAEPPWWWLVAAALLVVWAVAPLAAQNMPAEVERVLATPQKESGEQLERLVELGEAAVPALLEKLSTARHPMVIVQALGRLGDARATLPLVELLNRSEPFAREAGERKAQRLIIIAALREIGDWRAEPLLRLIFLDDQVEVATRLAAATALARLGSPEMKAAASAFILEVAEATSRGDYGNLHVAGPFRQTDLNQALFEVGSAETQAMLIERLRVSGLAHEELALIELLARRPDAGAAAALLEFAERPGGEPFARLQAAKALVRLGTPQVAKLGIEYSQERLLAALEDIRARLPASLKEEAQRVREGLEERPN